MSQENKSILVLGTDLFGSETISNIVGSIIDFLTSNNYIFCGFAKHEKKRSVKDNVVSYSLVNPLESFHPLLRMRRKLLRLFKKDDSHLLKKYLIKKCESLFDFKQIKEIIAISGNFAFMHAAFQLSKENKIELKLIYFDVFSNSPFILNNTSRVNCEKEWSDYAKSIYRDSSSDIQIQCDNPSKIHDFKIPIKVIQNDIVDGLDIIYGGMFYKTFRKPDKIIEFALAYPSQSFIVYSNFSTNVKYKNLKFLPLLSREEYEKVLKNAKAVIVIGNGSHHSFLPSKFLEAIAYKKTIIGIDIDCDELKKYPFYFDYKDPYLIKKIEDIQMMDKKEYNVLEHYSERDPFNFAKVFE